MTRIIQIISDYWAWFIGFAGLATALSWLPGFGVGVTILTSGLRLIASFFEIISPVVNAVFSGVIYLWKEVLYPGLLDILDSIKTIITVGIIFLLMFLYFDIKYKIKTNNLEREVGSLKESHRTKQEPEPVEREEFSPFKLLPWNW